MRAREFLCTEHLGHWLVHTKDSPRVGYSPPRPPAPAFPLIRRGFACLLVFTQCHLRLERLSPPALLAGPSSLCFPKSAHVRFSPLPWLGFLLSPAPAASLIDERDHKTSLHPLSSFSKTHFLSWVLLLDEDNTTASLTGQGMERLRHVGQNKMLLTKH